MSDARPLRSSIGRFETTLRHASVTRSCISRFGRAIRESRSLEPATLEMFGARPFRRRERLRSPIADQTLPVTVFASIYVYSSHSRNSTVHPTNSARTILRKKCRPRSVRGSRKFSREQHRFDSWERDFASSFAARTARRRISRFAMQTIVS